MAAARSGLYLFPMTDSSHPILQSLTLSEAQAEAAFGPADVLVTAGAGTGKTWALTARFLALLAQGVPLRSIVAITFTRKAAREMRKRIREQVSAHLARSDLDEAERSRWNNIASQLDAARISTIHSLCQEILRSHPVEARVDPDFQVLEEHRTTLMQHEAVEEALFWAATQESLAGLLAEVEDWRVRNAVAALLKLGLEARELLQNTPSDTDALMDVWDKSLAEMQRERVAEILADSNWLEARDVVVQAHALNDSDKLAIQVARAREAVDRLMNEDGFDALRQAASILGQIDVRGGKKEAWPGGKEQVNEIKAALKQLRAPFSRRFGAWLYQGLNAEDKRSARALVQLRTIALRAFAIYEARKRDAQALDFDDLETRAVLLLAEHPPVRAYWQGQVQALLVDEFQDTNARQARLLELLDGGQGKRFLVGDAKQSIYRFRGAEVEVFIRTEDDFKGRGKCVARLNATYRAHADLVESLNGLLQPVLGEARFPWEASFAPLKPARDREPLAVGSAYIEVQLAAGTKEEALPAAARIAVNRMLELFEQGYDPGDVAILCRAATSFAAYEDALEQAGVPYITLAGRGFFQRPEVRDLAGVMRAAADLTDDTALVGALRSPGLGLSDIALYHLARTRERMMQAARDAGAPRRVSLWEATEAAMEDEFLAEELSRLHRARELLQTLHTMAGRVSVADLLKAYVDATDYLAILAAAGRQRAVRNVNKLLADVQQAGLIHVASFLDWLEQVQDTGAREGEAPVVAEGAVQIMSVHRAKGLEFPIVVLGDITYSRNARDDLVISEGNIAWKLSTLPGEDLKPAFFIALQRQEARKEEAEDRRLFYVAATRAEDMLIINGYAGKRNRNSGWLKWIKLALPELDALLQDEVESVVEQTCRLEGVNRPVRCLRFPPGVIPLRAYVPQAISEAPPPFQPEMLASFWPEEDALDADTLRQETEPERRVWRIFPPREGTRAWAPSWMVGKLVHRAIELERMPDAPGFEAWLRASARSLGLSDEGMLKDAVKRTRRLLGRLAASSFWAEIQAAEQRMHEVPYAYLDPNKNASARGTIDLVYRTGENWTLVDFKTDRAKNRAHMEAIIREEAYDSQVARYVRAMQTLLNASPRALICFLDVSGKIEVWEWPMARDD